MNRWTDAGSFCRRTRNKRSGGKPVAGGERRRRKARWNRRAGRRIAANLGSVSFSVSKKSWKKLNGASLEQRNDPWTRRGAREFFSLYRIVRPGCSYSTMLRKSRERSPRLSRSHKTNEKFPRAFPSPLPAAGREETHRKRETKGKAADPRLSASSRTSAGKTSSSSRNSSDDEGRKWGGRDAVRHAR